MLRFVLVFLAGLLVGANAVYYMMTRDRAPAAVVAPSTATGSPPRGATAGAAPSDDAPAAVRAEPTTAPTQVDVAPAVPSVATDPAVVAPSGLIVPVQGIAATQLSDTYSDTRSEGRTHEAIDIMAPRGTPVLAVADGTVEKLFDSKQGGLTLYQFEPSGRYAYYYAHLDRYAAGMVEGKALRRGELIGYVGSTGNANPDGPHLHFAVFVLGPGRQWWKGTAINPYPLLGGR